MSDGTAVRTTRMPLMSPTSDAERQRRGHADDDRRAEVAGDDRDGHRAGRDHRADGDVELAGDHQQTDRERDDAEVGGDVELARGARRRDEVDAAEDREEDEDEDQAEERAGLGPAEQAAEGEFAGLSARVAPWCRTSAVVWAIIGCPCVQGPMTVCAARSHPGSACGMEGPARRCGPDDGTSAALSARRASRRPASGRRWRRRRWPGRSARASSAARCRS